MRTSLLASHGRVGPGAPWTTETVTAGLCGFYHGIAGVGLVFPLAAKPIAVEYPGYPVITLRPIVGLEFVEDAVTALGSSTELPTCFGTWDPSSVASVAAALVVTVEPR